ncbi:hypothetical protein FOB41_18140 [Agrobacterium pusense]|uniref:Uncharacterized protein n=2 Tax=Agrobacterium pusense TaxID=648995 RepID=A0A6H0ZQI6_9HYPH|nr:hypothetical protein FOB41_18140 [Agrobacterium pusense]
MARSCSPVLQYSLHSMTAEDRTHERGVIAPAMPQGDIIGLAPPLRLKCEEAEEVVRFTADAVRQVLGQMRQPMRFQIRDTVA